jgi:hypothetical protein
MRAIKLEDFPFDRRPVVQTPRVEKSLDRLGWLMDDLFRVPILGWRFGLDALVGLIPGIGDTSTALVSFYILASAVRYRVPKITLLRMGLNIALDYAVGSLPVVGDFVDAWWKANQKNVALLKERATVSAEEARKGRLSDWLFVGVIILGLAGLAITSAFISFYLLFKLTELLTGAGT